ncbi:hypothetical protein VTK56DRAFT_5509 [Thermocarpiscus australiensis]
MGIPHLKRHLEPYAERAVIEPCDAVVDGPALAYHVLGLCARTVRRTSPFEQPWYGLLGRTAVAWLDRIQACGLSVAVIYFDSHLPVSKRTERIQRLIKSTRDLIKYHSTFLTGVPKGALHRDDEAEVDLFPHSWPGEAKAKPPPPPFLVPAIIDALRESPAYRSVIRLVPGEADGFCAQHVRIKGGIVLTSDSDLLVHDLGPDGNVVFLADIDADLEGNRLISPQYRPADLCRRLAIKPKTGIPYLAFEICKDPHLSLKQAVEKSKMGDAISTPQGYSDFVEQYVFPEVSSVFEAGEVPALDPRVSEIVLQFLAVGSVADTKRARPIRDDIEPEIYLPFLLDCPSRTSAWEPSKPERQLAYAILQSTRGGLVPSVSEMRRLQSMSTGTHVDVPGPADIDGSAASLLELLRKIESGVSKFEVAWVVLSTYQDIIMTLDRARGYPLSLQVLAQEASGKLDVCSWEFLHFLAQTQATCYSLRMLGQILEVAKHRQKQSSTMSKLASFLLRLPSLPEFPSPTSFAGTLRQLRQAGGLSCLQSLCSDFDDILPHIESVQRPQDTKKAKKSRAMASTGDGNTRALSSNPFDLLVGSEE